VPALAADLGQGTAELVWSVMLDGITECGIPAMSLADNGMVYTGRLHAFEAAFEANLRALGTHTINSTPSHPQTCGKIERFWQTLKKWLRAQANSGHHRETQRPPGDISQLLQPPPPAPGAARCHASRCIHRHCTGPTRRPAAARTGFRQPPHRR
jgi:hypothetical protein